MKDELTIKLTVEELNLILQGLSEMPFKTVYDLIGKLNAQANDQLAKR
ncbi:MAG: hypothetical protein AAF502_23395 [Bacteroidota bacterium]